ncbi:hypothetical protein BDW75DRAFT_241795 [Aspergillus navahoensis]
MALGRRFTELTGLDITDLISSVVETFAVRSAYSLEQSQHAPRKEIHDRLSQRLSQVGFTISFSAGLSDENNLTHYSSLSSSIPPSTPSPTYHNDSLHNLKKDQTTMGTRIADVDDTAAFMAAARSFKLEKEYGKPPAPSEDATSEQEAPPFMQDAGDAQESFEIHGDAETHGAAEADQAVILNQSSVVGNGDLTPKSGKHQPEFGQNRGDLMTFHSWRIPEARDKPAAQVRRIIIKDLPSSWRTPDKVLSLVHGGQIDSVSITTSGNAHVVFCDAAACRSFYDRYPKGIDLDKERKLIVFVELGQEVDVVSSQLSFALSAGSTRVVRAVGVEMNVALAELVKFATGANRKLEKIIDTYVPGRARSVSFRFCSIRDAVHFRAAFVRVEKYEQCNIHYAADPCEVATGYHAD